MKKCMFCLVVDDSHLFRNNNNTYAKIKTTYGKIFAPIVEVERRTIEELKIAVNKTVTEAFEKMQKKTKAKIDKPRIQKEKTKHVNQNSEVENSTTQVRWPMERLVEMKTQREIECKNDLACVTGILLKACPILKKSLPHAYWLEYLHTARYTARKLNSKEQDVVARTAGCLTIEEAIIKAEV